MSDTRPWWHRLSGPFAVFFNGQSRERSRAGPSVAIDCGCPTVCVVVLMIASFAAPVASRGANGAIRDCSQTNDPVRAITGCSALLQGDFVSPRFKAMALVNRGIAFTATGDREKALADFDEAIGADPSFFHAYYSRGLALVSGGQQNLAFADFEAAIRINPGFSDSYNNRGFLYWKFKGDIDHALADFNTAIALDAHNARARINRALVLSEKGDHAGALVDFESALRLEPRNAGLIAGRNAERNALANGQNGVPGAPQSVPVRDNNAAVSPPGRAEFNALTERWFSFQHAGKYEDALRTIEGFEAKFDARSRDQDVNFASISVYKASTLDGLGRFKEANDTYARALSLAERMAGRDAPYTGQVVDSWAQSYVVQGRFNDAERLDKRLLEIDAKANSVKGGDKLNIARILERMASAYAYAARYEEAEQLYNNVVAIYERAGGKNQQAIATVLNNFAVMYEQQDRYSDAGPLLKRALAIQNKAPGGAQAELLGNLADVYTVEGHYDEAEALLKRALSMQEQRYGANSIDVGARLMSFAQLRQSQGRYDEAQGYLLRAIAIFQKDRNPDDVYLAQPEASLAKAYLAAGDEKNALDHSRKATHAILANAAIDATSAVQPDQAGGLIQRRSDLFKRHVAIVAAASRRGIAPDTELGPEAFKMAQWAVQSSAATAVQQMGARLAAGNDTLAALVRDSQDLGAQWRVQNKRLVDSAAQGQQAANNTEALRRDLADTENRLAAAQARLSKEFPDYFAFANPTPLGIDEVQRLVGSDEALVFLLDGGKESHVFALTREAFLWQAIPLDSGQLSSSIASFRRGLDPDDEGKPESFDLGRAHDLYAALLGPVDALIRDKRHLLVVPSGPLTSLPFHLLVTEKPEADARGAPDYGGAAWLLKRQAVSVLPSVVSLKVLRGLADKTRAGKPMVGFGDPVFKADQSEEPVAKQAPPAGRRLQTRAYTDVWKGAGVDRAKLSESLPALPDTADELNTIASKLGASPADLHLGLDASEATVKRTPLADYRVVYFATHGLVAGDVKGVAEPSLALTLPRIPSEFDDGLLTASEIAELKLNADWAVLSACNTIAGDRPGAEALSGLARAFFYAGARTLLVSHWAVESEAAIRLTTSTFEWLKSRPDMQRAEALRQATLAYLNDRSDPRNANPSRWGPFSIVGEGWRP
jgi:CHAT domain-containing protein/Tfp pilus assembly protein PilF